MTGILDLGATRILAPEAHGEIVVIRCYDPRRPAAGFRLELTCREADLFAGHITATVTEIVAARNRVQTAGRPVSDEAAP